MARKVSILNKWFLLLMVAVQSIVIPLHGQDSQLGDDPVIIDLEQIDNNSERVEIQRYFGYENLLFSYLTLPYDISMSTRQGRYFDIGYLIFALFPLAFLAIVYRRQKAFYLAKL